MSLAVRHVRTIQRLTHTGQYQHISTLILFHHLRITALLTLVPSDILVHITTNNNLYTLILPRPSNMDASYRLHLFLNPHDRLSYFRHIYDVNTQFRYRLDITNSLPATGSRSNCSWCRPMMHTTTHTPDLGTTFTFR